MNTEIAQQQKAFNIGNAYAKSIGKDNIKTVMNDIKTGLDSNDPTQNELAKIAARGTVEALTKLLLKQEIFTTPDQPYMEWISTFDDGVVKEGNGKIYDFNNLTSCDTYKPGEFIPTALSTPDVDEFKILMYKDNQNHELTNQAYQFRKPLVYIESQWIPYFKRGNLSGFIAQLQAQINKSWKFFIFDKIAKLITTMNPKKVINSTAQNAFEAWNEFLQEIRKMRTASSDYNYNAQNTNILSSQPGDLIVIAHPKTIQTLQSGIKTQLFQADLLNLKGILNDSNFIDLGRQIEISTTDPNQKIAMKADYYCNETTLYVVRKDAIKHIHQINSVATTYYSSNMAMETVAHIWGAIDFLPWSQCFKFTCANLNTLP